MFAKFEHFRKHASCEYVFFLCRNRPTGISFFDGWNFIWPPIGRFWPGRSVSILFKLSRKHSSDSVFILGSNFSKFVPNVSPEYKLPILKLIMGFLPKIIKFNYIFNYWLYQYSFQWVKIKHNRQRHLMDKNVFQKMRSWR